MRLLKLRLENIGGYGTAELDTVGNRVLIGENNSGKTALLRVLNWVFNEADRELLGNRRILTEAELALLVPARETRNRARRIVLTIEVADGRSRRKYCRSDGPAELRIQFRSDAVYARLTPPKRGEKPESEKNALDLLRALQEAYCAVYIGAARDSGSTLFRSSLEEALRARFVAELIQRGSGRSSRKVAALRDNTTKLNGAGQLEANQVWTDIRELLGGLFQLDAQFELNISPEEMIEHLIPRVHPTFAVGDHDAGRVPIEQLGAGTQSALAISLMQLAMRHAEQRLLLIEEPEAFLHPSAQQGIAGNVLHPRGMQVIATTHSAHVLAEAKPSEVVVLRNHGVYTAIPVSDLQEEKDEFLLRSAAGSMFDRSLLIVEGPGDAAFMDGVRRRLTDLLPADVVCRMRVVWVGSNTSFGPWLRLLGRYKDPNSGEAAYRVIVCADSKDATAPVLRAFRESDIAVSTELKTAIRQIPEVNGDDDPTVTIAQRTIQVNQMASEHSLPLHFSLVDLEYAITAGLSDRRAAEFGREIGVEASNAVELAEKLGSSNLKKPYIRSKLARFLTWEELSDDMKSLIVRWIAPAWNGDEFEPPAELHLRSMSSRIGVGA
jgi:energy-coupling factor transporter ATP-binding protein EcfA2